MTRKSTESAVSPVIGVMLMLVVTIIIAAIVSAFSGGITSGQSKAPQANVKGTFSITDGLTITNAGGDSLATKDLVFTIRDGPTFGANLESTTARNINMTTILVKTSRTSGSELPMRTTDAAFYMTSFNPGDTVRVQATDTTCNILQPGIEPTDFTSNVASDGYTYKGGKTAAWALCIRNQNSIGKSFSLEVSDSAGRTISKSDVLIMA
jgi:archaeal type IV pilus assembly protein PilA